MTNIQDYILGGILAGLPLILYLINIFVKEFTVTLAKRIFKRKSKKTARLAFDVLMLFLFVAGLLVIYNNIMQQEDKKEEEKIENYQKSNAEVILQGAEETIALTKEIIEKQKNKNDSLIKERGKKLVYKIGNIKDNKTSVFETYNRLIKETSLDSSKIKVFYVKRNQYFIFYDFTGTEEEINRKLDTYKEIIKPVEPVVTITDIYKNCSAKELIIDTKPLLGVVSDYAKTKTYFQITPNKNTNSPVAK